MQPQQHNLVCSCLKLNGLPLFACMTYMYCPYLLLMTGPLIPSSTAKVYVAPEAVSVRLAKPVHQNQEHVHNCMQRLTQHIENAGDGSFVAASVTAAVACPAQPP